MYALSQLPFMVLFHMVRPWNRNNNNDYIWCLSYCQFRQVIAGVVIGCVHCDLRCERVTQVIHLEFTAFDLEDEGDCKNDNVTIFDGQSVTPMQTLCRNDIPPPVMSSESVMIVKFTSNASGTFTGFSVKYTTIAGKCSHQLKLYLFG